jgi:ABC-2 type transport system permease protein
VKDIFLVARTHLVTAFRERITLFWFLVFPVFLLVLLSLIFGRTGREGEINFPITLINRDQEAAQPTEFAAMVEDLFRELGTSTAEGKEPLFTLYEAQEGEALDAFLASEQKALRRGERAAIIVLPEGFTRGLSAQISTFAQPSDEESNAPTLMIYMSRNNVASEMATSIIEQILAEVDREILTRTGLFKASEAIESETIWVGGQSSEVRYIDFLLPGVILMGFFTNGLFGVPGAILFGRDLKILRRYWVTPLTVPRFLAGFSLGHLSLCVIQFFLLFLIGRYGFGAMTNFARPQPVLFLLLSATTFLAFGFFIASVAKSATAGMAIAEVLNMPMMFLSGLFFPTGGLPLFLTAIVYVNPVSYLAQGVRMSLGVETETFAPALVIAVPLAWIALSTAVATFRLRWDVER